MSRDNYDERPRLVIAVLTLSMLSWNMDCFLFNSDKYKAMLPMIRPFMIELTTKIGIATESSFYVEGQISPTPKR